MQFLNYSDMKLKHYRCFTLLIEIRPMSPNNLLNFTGKIEIKIVTILDADFQMQVYQHVSIQLIIYFICRRHTGPPRCPPDGRFGCMYLFVYIRRGVMCRGARLQVCLFLVLKTLPYVSPKQLSPVYTPPSVGIFVFFSSSF